MTPNPLLAIAIPTYNRALVLKENLRAMMPELLEHQVAVYISDDSTDDITAQMIEELYKYFPLIFYRKNNPRYGHDANFFATLSMPDTDYVWYLGDSIFFTPGTLTRVLITLKKFEPDFCFVNSYTKDDNSRIIEGASVHKFLLDRTWYLTLSGATIYNRNSINKVTPNELKTQWKNFPQLGLILESCSQYNPRLYWIGTPGLEFNKKKSSYWLHSAFDVFAKDWSNLIYSFELMFNRDEMNKIIQSHSKKTKLFSLTGLIKLRSIGALSKENINKHKNHIKIAVPTNFLVVQLISFIPQNFLRDLIFFSKTALNFFRRQRRRH